MKFTSTITTFLLATLASNVSFAEECADIRTQVESYWEVVTGERSRSFDLTPMALTTKNPTTTMPQLALVCRKDSAAGTVSIFGDEIPFNASLSANECRLIFVLGVKTISAEANDDVTAQKVCGSFNIIR